MSTDPDTMTPEQLRDALAVAAFGTTSVYIKDSDGAPGRRENPIPALDSPDALGVIAEIMPSGWNVTIDSDPPRAYGRPIPPGAKWSAFAFKYLHDEAAFGTTEAIARARLVLKVLAATKTPAV